MSAAEVLAAHIYSTVHYQCSCLGEDSDTMTVAEFAAHQLDALKAAGYAVVELPTVRDDTVEMTFSRGDAKRPLEGYLFLETGRRNYWGGTLPVEIETRSVPFPLTAEHARTYAAALLAAANAAEASQ